MTKTKRIFISNRLPFSVDPKSGKIQRGSGGLVSALLGVDLENPFVWMGFETKSESAEQLRAKSADVSPNLRIHPVLLDSKTYDRYYDRFSNDVLWPLFHYESENCFFQKDNWEAYLQANQKMADEVSKVANSGDTVWIHDFHFMALPEMLRRAKPDLKIGFFLHTPFPSHEIFRQLPVREQLLKSMLQCDLIGFHDHSYLRHFTVSLKAQLGIDASFFRAEYEGHSLHLGVYPISIDTEQMRTKAATPKVRKQEAEYERNIRSDFLILGVDRLDYSKGLELKLKGFRRALEKYPELRGRANLLQVAVPTRVKVPSYMKLKRQMDQLVGQINGEYAQPGYTPVSYMFNSVNETQLLGLYRRAEGLLITSKRDGMNLVAIEYAITQNPQDPGVVMLSEFAGVASLLGDALILNPWDEDSIADSIYRAYKMPADERIERMTALQEMLSKYSASRWAQSFLEDLDRNFEERVQPSTVDLPTARSQWPSALAERIGTAQKIVLVLDYDGTIVQLAQKPELAVLSSVQKDFLRELQNHADIHIVSGRDKNFLDEQFRECNFLLVAEHGAFYKWPDNPWISRVSSDVPSWMGQVRRVMEGFTNRVPLSFIEEKEAAIVCHYRQSPPSFAEFQAKKLFDELQVGLANDPVSVVSGSKIVEAKATECNKGNFLRWLMQQTEEGTLFICIGDDRTDEDMFRLAGDNGISIKVGSGPSAAQYRLGNQRDVAVFLGELLLQLRKTHTSPTETPTAELSAEKPQADTPSAEDQLLKVVSR